MIEVQHLRAVQHQVHLSQVQLLRTVPQQAHLSKVHLLKKSVQVLVTFLKFNFFSNSNFIVFQNNDNQLEKLEAAKAA